MSIDVLLNKVREWAREQQDIRLVLLVGSYARGKERPESDVDLVIITNQPTAYIKDTSFTKQFGRVYDIAQENYGRVTSIRVWYDQGLEVEFGITAPLWIATPLDAGTKRVLADGFQIIVDKDDALGNLGLL